MLNFGYLCVCWGGGANALIVTQQEDQNVSFFFDLKNIYSNLAVYSFVLFISLFFLLFCIYHIFHRFIFFLGHFDVFLSFFEVASKNLFSALVY